jgi:hypothetical protein
MGLKAHMDPCFTLISGCLKVDLNSTSGTLIVCSVYNIVFSGETFLHLMSVSLV